MKKVALIVTVVIFVVSLGSSYAYAGGKTSEFVDELGIKKSFLEHNETYVLSAVIYESGITETSICYFVEPNTVYSTISESTSEDIENIKENIINMLGSSAHVKTTDISRLNGSNSMNNSNNPRRGNN